MLITASRHCETVGSVGINEVQRILKLESDSFEDSSSMCVSGDQLDNVMDEMMIAVPVKDEMTNLLDGVLRAIPDRCQVCVVSNSPHKKGPSFAAEKELVRRDHDFTKHPVCIVHQTDKELGEALQEAGYHHILDGDGTVRNGKAEGMMVALLMAKHFKKKYIGFIDADNYIPGAVNEYVSDFAAGFCMSDSPHVLVRLHWRYKPKIIGKRLRFRKWGRVSETTNRYLNQFIAEQTGFGTDVMKTGNAGEHAITMSLAEKMCYSTGYSIEPYHIVHLLESYGKGGSGDQNIMEGSIDVRQIETLNPHFHEEKGGEHVKRMLVEALSTIYHSEISSEALKSRIMDELRTKGVVGKGEAIPANIKIPSIEDVDINRLVTRLTSQSGTYLNLT